MLKIAKYDIKKKKKRKERKTRRQLNIENHETQRQNRGGWAEKGIHYSSLSLGLRPRILKREGAVDLETCSPEDIELLLGFKEESNSRRNFSKPP
jgi:hypothetical protein